MKEEKSFLVKSAEFIDDNGAELAQLITTGLGYAVVGVLYEINKPIFNKSIESQTLGLYCLIVVFILNLILGFILMKKRKSVSEIKGRNLLMSGQLQALEDEIDGLYADYNSIFKDQLAIIFHRLSFTANERISIYKHSNDKFTILGRYSLNHNLNKIRRNFYPEDQGFIKVAWENEDGELYINNLPEFVQGNRTEYFRRVNEVCQIDREIFDEIRMKSRCYYLKAITDEREYNRIAVMVIESLNPEGIDLDSVNEVIAEEKERLVSFIKKMKKRVETKSIASKSGF